MPRVLLLSIILVLAQHVIAAQPPTAKIVVVHPQSDRQLTGCVEVRLKTELQEGASEPQTVYVGLGGAPWTALKRSCDGWTATIDSTLGPNGNTKLIVLTDNPKLNTSIAVTVTNPLQVFFADLHSHTSYSDGTLVPAAAHQYARDVTKLDVFCLTDHLESLDDREWLDTREVAFDANVDGTFVAFPGLEWTKEWGHLNIYDPRTRHWPTDPQEFYKAAADAGVVTKFDHPGDGSVTHDGLAYSEIGDKTVQLMEVRNATEEKAFIRALNNGWHIAPEGSSDTHGPDWGNTGPWTGIYAPGLSKQNILEALAKRRCYSTLIALPDTSCEPTAGLWRYAFVWQAADVSADLSVMRGNEKGDQVGFSVYLPPMV